MGTPIIITVTADTSDATQKLQALTQDLPQKFEGTKRAAEAAAESLGKNRMAYMELGHVARATAEGLAAGISPMRMAAFELPRVVQAMMNMEGAGAALKTAFASMGPALAVVGGAVALGALSWSHYRSELNRTEEQTRRTIQALKDLPQVVKDISVLTSTSLVTGSQAAGWLAKLGAIPPRQPASSQFAITGVNTNLFPTSNAFQSRPLNLSAQGYVQADELKRLQEELSKQGYLLKSGTDKEPTYQLNPQIEALQSLQELQKKVREDSLSGFELEKEKAKQTYDEMIQAADKYAAVAGHFFTGENLDALKKQISDAYKISVQDIDLKRSQADRDQSLKAFEEGKVETARRAKDAQADLERQLTLEAAQQGGSRAGLYEREYQQRKLLFDQQLYAGEIDENQYTAAVMDAQSKRLEGERTVQNAIAEIRGELRLAGETGLEADLAGIDLKYDKEIARIKDLNLALEEELGLIDEVNAARDREKDVAVGGFEKTKTKITEEESRKRVQIQQDELNSTASILGSGAQLAKAFGREGFAAWKALALGQAIISGAAAVLLQLGSGDPYSAPWRAAASAAAAAVQIATIAATQPSGYAEGGYTGDGGKYEYAGPVHKGEFVMPADKTARHRPLLEAMHQGREMSFNVPSEIAPQRAAQLMMPAEASQSSSAKPPPVEVAVGFINDRSSLREFLEGSVGKQIILKHFRENRIDLGFDT